MTDTLLEVEDLQAFYGPIPALHGIDFTIGEGKRRRAARRERRRQDDDAARDLRRHPRHRHDRV